MEVGDYSYSFRCDDMSRDGRYLYAVCSGQFSDYGDGIAVYEFDASDGTITLEEGSPYEVGDLWEYASLVTYSITGE